MTGGAGGLDRRITIEFPAEGAADAHNHKTIVWLPVATLWAKKTDVSDGEKAAAQQVGSTLTSRFVIRSSILARSFTPQHRITYGGVVWNIEGIKETQNGRDAYLEITATKDAD